MTPEAPDRPARRSADPFDVLAEVAVAANAARSLRDGVESVLEILVEAGGWELGHAYRLEPDGEQMVPLNLWWPPGPDGWTAFRKATARQVMESGAGLVGRVQAQAEPVWLEDIGGAEWYIRRSVATEAGLRSTLAFPVMAGERVVASIELWSTAPREASARFLEVASHTGAIVGRIFEREAAEGRFRTLFDVAPVPIGLAGESDFRFVEVNDAFLQALRYDREELLGHNPEELGLLDEPWDRDRVRAALRRGGPLDLELDARTREGEIRRLVGSAALVEWRGAPHVLCSFVDVTRLKQAEQDLLRQGTQIRLLARNVLRLQEEERTRLSRELHDVLGQRVTAIKMALRRGLGPEGDPEAARTLEELADRLLEDLRTLAFELRPSMLDDLGLPAAIRSYVDRTAASAGLSCDVVVDEGAPTLDADARSACFRILQEAVTNVLRHADASRLRVELGRTDDATVLTVEDDGRGPAHAREARADSPSMGLRIMQERASQVGGTLEMSEGPEGGTVVRAVFPVRGSPHRGERR